MNNENQKGMGEAQELMDFLAAGKEANRVGEREEPAREHHEKRAFAKKAAKTKAHADEEPLEEAVSLMAALIKNGSSDDEALQDLTSALLSRDEPEANAEDAAFFAQLDKQLQQAAEPEPAAKPVSAAPAAPAEPEPEEEPEEDEEEPDDEPVREKRGLFRRRARRVEEEPDEEDDEEEEDEEEDEDDEDDDEDSVRRPRRRGLIAGVVAAVLCLALLGGSLMVSGRRTIFPNVTVHGTEVEGMTVEQAASAVKDAGWDGTDGTVLRVELPGDFSLDVPSGAAGWTASANDAAQAAWDYGRGGNLFSNFFTFLHCKFSGHDVAEELSDDADTAALRKLVVDKVTEANLALSDGNMEVDTEKKELRIIKGGDMMLVDSEDVYAQVLEALDNHESKLSVVKPLDEDADVKELDMQKLHDEVCGEPENASYDVEKKEVVEGKPGVEFDVKEAQRLWDAANPGEQVKIPLEVTEPEFKKENVKELYTDKLASKSTSLSGSTANRINNITLAAQKIDGVILEPGQIFSYNNTVGQRTTANGFKEAGAYANGEVVSEVGGGICQVSSTLYYCAMTANLKITARTNHYFAVGYIEPGMDATVSWGAPDFQFQNTRTFPVKIHAYVSNGQVTVELLGTDVDGSTVKMDYTTSGMTTTTFRNLYDKDGKLVNRTQEAVSTYHAHQQNTPRPVNTPRPAAPTPTPKPAAPTPTPAAPTPTPAAPTPTPEAPTPTPTVETPAPPTDDPGEVIDEPIENPGD